MKPKRQYRAVFFDAGGTLFKPHPSVGHIYARVARKYGMHVDEEKVEQIFHQEFSKRDKEISIKAHASEENEKEWWRELVRFVFSQVVHLKRFDEFFEELYDVFATAETWKLYPEVIPVLEELRKRHLILGIVSNWDSRLFSICESIGVKKYFDFILASAVVGSAKPDQGIFKEALKKANVAPSETIHVGDSVDNDFFGAKRVGIHAVLISRNGHGGDGVMAVDSLTRLIALVDGEGLTGKKNDAT